MSRCRLISVTMSRWHTHPARAPMLATPTSDTSEAVRTGARERAQAMLCHAIDPPRGLLDAIETAATFHDLGKLDPANQAVLKRGRGGRLRWDHIDAGVAHLSGEDVQDWMSAWLIRAHHAPGPPGERSSTSTLMARSPASGQATAMRTSRDRHAEQQSHTDVTSSGISPCHEAALGLTARPNVGVRSHGMTMRLALSCLVDADHADTAFFDTGRFAADSPPPRWEERLESLCRYVRDLPVGETSGGESPKSTSVGFLRGVRSVAGIGCNGGLRRHRWGSARRRPSPPTYFGGRWTRLQICVASSSSHLTRTYSRRRRSG